MPKRLGLKSSSVDARPSFGRFNDLNLSLTDAQKA